jgi:hypothetical protein
MVDTKGLAVSVKDIAQAGPWNDVTKEEEGLKKKLFRVASRLGKIEFIALVVYIHAPLLKSCESSSTSHPLWVSQWASLATYGNWLNTHFQKPHENFSIASVVGRFLAPNS